MMMIIQMRLLLIRHAARRAARSVFRFSLLFDFVFIDR